MIDSFKPKIPQDTSKTYTSLNMLQKEIYNSKFMFQLGFFDL